MYKKLSGGYLSPRITGEFLDCSMPMTFDQFSNCGFGCVYCFSQFQRGVNKGSENYFNKSYKSVSLSKIKKIFENLDDPNNVFAGFIKNRITMQWGGLSDPFCPIEEQDGTGYEILSYLKSIRYPINFSSKSDLILRDEKYLKLFEGMGDVWSYKASIITLDEEKAKIVEAGVPSPQRRMEVLKKLGEMGIWTIWRMRPFIIGLTSLDYEKQIEKMAEIGVKAMSTEFFCLELRSVNSAKAHYDILSKVVGFDIIQFYKNISNRRGYLRLNRSIKEPYYQRMKELCDKYGINFHVSDAQGKEYTCSGSCCGLPQDKDGNPTLTNFSKCQFTNALNIAKRKGEVSWKDIEKDDTNLFNIDALRAPGLNTGSTDKRQKCFQMNLLNRMRNVWNNPNEDSSPYKYFGGIMFPDRIDEDKNVVYKYRPLTTEKKEKEYKLKKVIVVVGQSASGKTTYAKQNFIKEGGENKRIDDVKLYQNGSTIALGNYYIGKRCEGTDTLPYNIIDKVVKLLPKLDCETLVVEGDRINCKKFYDAVSELNVPVDVYYLKCSIELSLERRGDNSEKFVKTTATKSLNMFEYCKTKNYNCICVE
jgi:DNA repair photolyase